MNAVDRYSDSDTNSDDNFEITEESTLKLSDLLNYLENSPLRNMCKLVLTSSSPEAEQLNQIEIKHICNRLEKLLLVDLTFDQLTALFVASSMTYLLSRSFTGFEIRSELLHKVFRYSNSLDPIHLHITAKRLHQNINSRYNLQLLCKNISIISEMGNAVAMCLNWGMFFETVGKEIGMFCFHPLSTIEELVTNVDVGQMLNKKETTANAYFLFQLMADIVRSILFRPNEELKNAGYSEYFRYNLKDLCDLKDWLKKINQNISVSFNSSKTNYNLIMAVEETITFLIIEQLDDKIKTICDDY